MKNENAGCLIVLLLTIPGIILNGIALSQLWYWFIVPTFNAPPLGLAVAIGVSMTMGMFVNSNGSNIAKAKDTYDLITTAIAQTIVKPVFAIAIGFVITLFM